MEGYIDPEIVKDIEKEIERAELRKKRYQKKIDSALKIPITENDKEYVKACQKVINVSTDLIDVLNAYKHLQRLESTSLYRHAGKIVNLVMKAKHEAIIEYIDGIAKSKKLNKEESLKAIKKYVKKLK